MDDRFGQSEYVIRKKVPQIFGKAFHVYGADDTALFYTELKSKRFDADIRLCTDEGMDIEMLTIRPRQAAAMGLIFDVVDPAEQKILGVLQRKSFDSTFKDKWLLMPTGARYHGFIEEQNLALALIRRTIGMGPQTFKATMEGNLLSTFNLNLNPFVREVRVDFSPDTAGRFDHRLGIAAGILLAAIEGMKEV